MPELAVTAVGADRPGIVARVTGVLFEHGGNLEDSTMTILGGHFAIMLLVSTDTDPALLEEALRTATADLGLVVTVRRVGEGTATPSPTHVVSVYGPDRPGIVHEVTTALAALDVNVTDLETRVLGDDRPVYALVLECALPDGVTPGEVEAAVADKAPDVDVSVHPLEVESF